MKFNKVIRTIFPPIVGYLTYLFFDGLFEKQFPIAPFDEPWVPGTVILLQNFGELAYIGLGFVFQYKVIVPRTINSTKKVTIRAALFGIILNIISSFIDSFYRDSIMDILIESFRFLVEYESFVMGNLALLTLFNFFENKSKLKNGVTSKLMDEA
ncbi:hypothetical protein [Adhaeribacter pallidiroseus]|uniref:Uncharacterized protein n=1 Tax=Adhaeribacter pallidiroseus TaxID=2072847 RepID=A0A369QIB8_9BACT|nr:hypothetical protein [Adhaeribacter pallidiroseus]RDC63017.1 hypothetical protein AHMF7616_01616 [Adhaeribacter pallidiroseus]